MHKNKVGDPDLLTTLTGALLNSIDILCWQIIITYGKEGLAATVNRLDEELHSCIVSVRLN